MSTRFWGTGGNTKRLISESIKTCSLFLYGSLPRSLQKAIHNYVSWEARQYFRKNTSLFNAIFFEVRSRCNSSCAFCAASIQNETRPDVTLPFDLFKKTINELCDLRYDGKIAFHVNNDPLLVKDIAKYVAYAKEKCPSAWVQILTNGKSLNNKIGLELIDAKVDELSINIYREDHKKITPRNVQKFEEEILLKKFALTRIFYGHKPKVTKSSSASSINYNKFLRYLKEDLSNRAGSNPAKKNVQKVHNLGFCSYPFEQFNIDPNGNVSICCADFFFSSGMGNVNLQTVSEIWFGKKFQMVRESLLSSKRTKGTICDGCDYFGTRLPKKNIAKKIIWKALVK